MLRAAIVLCVALLVATLGGRAYAATYYVSPNGSDAKTGLSPADAWRTVDKVNNIPFQPGDRVLLEGGQTFDGPLVPWSSGRPGAPIAFASYGSGRATIQTGDNNIVFFPGVNWVTLDNLRLTALGQDEHVIVADPAKTNSFVTIQNCVITDTRAFGINDPSPSDHDWTIQNNTISKTAETGITFRGSNFQVIGNRVLATGLDPREAAHGIYAKGPNAQVIGNTITDFAVSGISIRYHGAIVRGNTIEGGPIGIGQFQERDESTRGTSVIAYNRISKVADAGMYLDGSTVESFVIANNTVDVSSGIGLNVHRVASLWLVNNVVTGTGTKYGLLAQKPTGLYREFNNLWYPAVVFGWNGADRSFADYAKGTGQGRNDLLVDPQLDMGLGPKVSSPLLDAGSRVVPGLRFLATCNGQPFSYCSRAPEIGAVERRSVVAEKVMAPPRRSAPTRAGAPRG